MQIVDGSPSARFYAEFPDGEVPIKHPIYGELYDSADEWLEMMVRRLPEYDQAKAGAVGLDAEYLASLVRAATSRRTGYVAGADKRAEARAALCYQLNNGWTIEELAEELDCSVYQLLKVLHQRALPMGMVEPILRAAKLIREGSDVPAGLLPSRRFEMLVRRWAA